MKIHAISTGTVLIKSRQPIGKGHGNARLMNVLLDPNWTPELPIYAWVIEHEEGLIVVDTGETARSSEPGYFPPWHPYYRLAVRTAVQPEEELGPQMKQLGLSPDDVHWVVMTHLHTDHAGGLYHFPEAEILVSRAEHEASTGFKGVVSGYLRNRWPSWFAPRLVDFGAEKLAEFRALPLTKSGDVTLISTPGHSDGHMSVMMQEGDVSIFLAGDTSYTEDTLLAQAVDGVAPDENAARTTLASILRYSQHTPTVYLPSHDPESAARLRKRQIVKSSE